MIYKIVRSSVPVIPPEDRVVLPYATRSLSASLLRAKRASFENNDLSSSLYRYTRDARCAVNNIPRARPIALVVTLRSIGGNVRYGTHGVLVSTMGVGRSEPNSSEAVTFFPVN